MTRRRLNQRQNQRGFALLLIFMMAAAIALMLYMQLPREAFESEREKEQLLIDRGERYRRAIYLYYVSNNHTWPSRIEDLESTNNHRYLAQRYVDPFTGKNEWRLIHTNGAFLTDSLVTPPPSQATPGSPGSTPGTPGGPGGTALASNTGASGSLGTFGTPTSAPSTSAQPNDPNAPPQVNSQVLRRASDQPLVQNSTYQSQPASSANPNDPGYQPFNPASLPPVSMFPNGYNSPASNVPGSASLPGSNQPGAIPPPGGINPPGAPVNGGTQPNGPVFTAPGTNIPVPNPAGNTPPILNFNQPGFNQPVVNQGGQSAANGNLSVSTDPNSINQPGFGTSTPQPNQPGAPGFPGGFGAAPGFGAPGAPGANPASNTAVNLINQLLTTPRQPPAGIGPGTQQQNAGGLAGVASTFKGVSIKSYADRTKYQEWEFVFQLSQLTTGLQAPVTGTGPNGAGGVPNGGPLGAPGSSGAPGAAPGQTASPFFTAPGQSAAPGQTMPGQTAPGQPANSAPGFTLTP